MSLLRHPNITRASRAPAAARSARGASSAIARTGPVCWASARTATASGATARPAGAGLFRASPPRSSSPPGPWRPTRSQALPATFIVTAAAVSGSARREEPQPSGSSSPEGRGGSGGARRDQQVADGGASPALIKGFARAGSFWSNPKKTHAFSISRSSRPTFLCHPERERYCGATRISRPGWGGPHPRRGRPGLRASAGRRRCVLLARDGCHRPARPGPRPRQRILDRAPGHRRARCDSSGGVEGSQARGPD
jgi:hypothetical protein